MRTILAAAVVLAMLGAGAAWAQGPAADLDRLQGTWVCVASVREGKPVADFVGVKVQFVDRNLRFLFPRKDGTTSSQMGAFTLDATQNPKHFDWADTKSPDRLHRRLYLVEGDVMLMSANVFKTETINAPGQRPTSFADGQFLFVLKRVPSGQ